MPRPSSDRTITDEIAALRGLVEQLAGHLECLIHSIDELTFEIHWRNNQLSVPITSLPPTVLTSLPLDPLAADWQINPVKLLSSGSWAAKLLYLHWLFVRSRFFVEFYRLRRRPHDCNRTVRTRVVADRLRATE